MLSDRKNHRLKGYDYRRYGYYYVTICTHDRQCLLSTIEIPRIVGSDALIAPNMTVTGMRPTLTDLGRRVNDCWNNIALVNENVEMGEYVIMPNHIHGIIVIKNIYLPKSEDIQYNFQIAERRGLRSLQGIVRDFKSVTTRIYKKFYGGYGSLWQESFYDEIIRSKDHYIKVCKYIEHNPKTWVYDELYNK